jgi:hypothetical protein
MQLKKTNSFDQKKFNAEFEGNDTISNKNKTLNKNFKYDIEKIILPHQQTVENIIINMRDLFFIIIDKLENQQNPIPFILSSDSRIFIFSLILIIFGTLLMLLSTLMISPKNI